MATKPVVPLKEDGIEKEVKFANAPTLGEMTDEQRNHRYAQLRQRLGKERLRVEGDKSRHYFWADKNDSAELIRLESLEYRVERQEDPTAVLKGQKKHV